MKRSDIAAGLVLAGVGLFVIQQSRMLTYRDEFGPGPGMLPLWLGGLLTVLASVQVFSAWTAKKGRGLKPATTSSREGSGGHVVAGFSPRASLRVLLVSVALAATVAALEVLGFFLTFGLLSFFLVYVIERRSLPRSIAVAVAITLAFLLVFRVMLPVQLPLSVWGF